MLIIDVRDNETIDKALKKYKYKFNRTGVMRELRDRKQFTKPSIKRRSEMLNAIYRSKKQAETEL
ncbi:MAG TPA: 30S ribosomal protein S21 [Saprospiraceae bacterium]|nr:30S ribosomal protein S21 [Saprospiraceae bacterium]HMQ82653.1 30S ribosomal protein S21 [Saprospiraceae bacterium]